MDTFGGGCVNPPAPEKAKQKKPKNSIGKTGSSFVSRIVAHPNLSQRLQERSSDGLYLFANINRAFLWLDMSSPIKVCKDVEVLVIYVADSCALARSIVENTVYESTSAMS